MAKEWEFVDNSCPTCGTDLTEKSPEHVSIATSDSPEPEAQERTVARCPACGAYVLVAQARKPRHKTAETKPKTEPESASTEPEAEPED